MIGVIPAAGLGTRLLPVTKSVPKALLPVAGKPAIQWALEEAGNAGIHDIVVVVSQEQSAVRDFLTPLPEGHPLLIHPKLLGFEQFLRKLNISLVEQQQPRGLGDSILCCRHLIGDNPFALLLPDNIIADGSRLLNRLLDVFNIYSMSCLALQHPKGQRARCGNIMAHHLHDDLFSVEQVCRGTAGKDQCEGFFGIGRYVLSPEMFQFLDPSVHEAELDDVTFLNGLAKDRRLLGLVTGEQIIHLGSDRFGKQWNGSSFQRRTENPIANSSGAVALHKTLREKIATQREPLCLFCL